MTWPLALVLALVLASCDRGGPPSGQVVARVDGVEITRRDVLIELMASGAPADVDTSKAQPGLLDRIVVRKLMAEEARRQSVDRSPEFLGQERRSRETILGEQLARRIVGRLPPPSPQAVARFGATHRTDFDRRRIFRVDRMITGATPPADILGLPSSELVVNRLRQRGIMFTRTLVDVDSMTLSPADQAAWEASAGRVFVTGTGSDATIDRVVATTPAPTNARQRVLLTQNLLRDRDARQALNAMIAQLRKTRPIEYAKGEAGHPVE